MTDVGNKMTLRFFQLVFVLGISSMSSVGHGYMDMLHPCDFPPIFDKKNIAESCRKYGISTSGRFKPDEIKQAIAHVHEYLQNSSMYKGDIMHIEIIDIKTRMVVRIGEREIRHGSKKSRVYSRGYDLEFIRCKDKWYFDKTSFWIT